MTLASGSRLGPYEILGPLGAGGMGEVYRARDGKLGRDVAIKVLPEAFASDAERLARFRREAKVLASLNHPHIAGIYGLEESGRVEALVLELVEGETLAERLAGGPLAIEEAVGIARQAAEALEAAHDRGIVHRDFKPANIKLTPEGSVKVLDFGLAKAFERPLDAAGREQAAAADHPMATNGMSAFQTETPGAYATQAGVALGTAAYMAPEQARGKAVDRRADVWAFGVVLYEMLTGRRAFEGESISDTLASVLKTDPDLSALPTATPASIRRLLRHCLRKDPSRRLRDIGDALLELDETAEPVTDAVPPAVSFPHGSRWGLLAALALGLAAGAVATWLFASRSRAGGSRAPMRFVGVTNFSGVESQPSISPDGRSVAFVSKTEGSCDIWVGLVAGGRLVRVTNDPGVEAHPAWSPDGTKIAYAKLKDTGLWDIWEIPALGGAPRRIVVDANEPAWSPDGKSLAYANLVTGTIWSCDASGSNPRALTQPDSVYRFHRQPAFSHDGRSIVFVRRQGGGPRSDLAIADIAGGPVRSVTDKETLAYSPVWSRDDQFLYFASSRGGAVNIWKIRRQGGEPEQITAGQGDDGDLSLSADGSRLAFSTYRENVNIGIANLDATGPAAALKWLTSDAARGEIGPSFSPDGKRIAYFSNRKGVEPEGIWVMDADGANAAQLVTDERQNVFPRWYADGKALLFRSSMATLGIAGDRYRRVAISGGPPEVVVPQPLGITADVDPEGRVVGDVGGHGAIYDPRTKKTQVLEACAGTRFRWSRDGSRVAYIGRAGGADAGLWIYDFRGSPRQVFAGWVVSFSWKGSEDLVCAQGQSDLTAVLWRVKADGSGQEKIPLTFSLASTFHQFFPNNTIDVSPDGRRLVLHAMEQQEADIGMIENVR